GRTVKELALGDLELRGESGAFAPQHQLREDQVGGRRANIDAYAAEREHLEAFDILGILEIDWSQIVVVRPPEAQFEIVVHEGPCSPLCVGVSKGSESSEDPNSALLPSA